MNSVVHNAKTDLLTSAQLQMPPIKYYHISEPTKCMKTHIHLMSAEQI